MSGYIEQWVPALGYVGLYEVSDYGNVRGVDRIIDRGRRWRGIMISQKTSKSGHRNVRLCCNGVHTWHWVHRLVLESFTGPCPDGMECSHNNGNPADNRVENLRWDTRKGNHADKTLHGTMACGVRNAKAKIDDASVREIFRLRAKGLILKDISAQFGVTSANVSMILQRKTWAHVEITS